MSLFTTAENLPFGVAFAMIVGVALLEGLGLMLAMSPSNMLDDWLPDIDHDSGLDKVLGWLHLGRVPSLVLLLLFLSGYAVFGYSLQLVMRGLVGHYLPAWLAGLAAVPAGLATVRALGALVAHIVPRDESSAVSELSLLGRVAVVSAGLARQGLAAQARVRDEHGRTHFVLVEPDLADETFDEGSELLLVKKLGAVYRAIRNPHPELMR
ncbi:MAG: YqiJ family protein [Burkholderiaceae bacterium]|nr:YqiJ family protein [Burkholderiaceae bacterium]